MIYKERLLIEFKQLVERMSLLSHFLRDTENKNIDKEQLELLERQYSIMCQYQDILINRILKIME